ncbi:MAG: HEAT repeat domain-containing protein [Candidatus Riflebacteria bacterium]|nr:HEAT repeat domain-containing protein [Candidatus Riflebacteria bacterium]
MDPVKDFFADLRSPDPSIRFSVLSRIEDFTLTEEQLKVFAGLLTLEQDPGIRFHMQKVLARSASREKGRADTIQFEELLNNPHRDEIALALLLESVKKGEAETVATGLRKAGWPSFSLQLLPSVLKFLKKFGSGEDVDAVAALCQHSDPRVLSAAIEALEKLNPERLREHIVPLLLNKNFGIRSRAVRILYRYDQSEAIRHFESMLFASSEDEKQAALFHSFFFPFKQIESLMLRYISVEVDPELIKKAGLVFMANPDRQIPMRLLEARQACVGEKYQLIDSILKGVLQSLFMAGIVNAEPAQMLQVLETHFREKRIKLFIERFSLGLKSLDPQTRLKSALKLCELLRHGVEEPRSLIEHFLKTEPEEVIRSQVGRFLESGTLEPDKVVQTPEQIKARSFSEYTSEQRHRILDSVTRENYDQIMAVVLPEIGCLETDGQVTVLSAIERYGGPKETETVLRFLDSDNSDLLTAAIDALSAINPEALHPLLPQLIKHRFDEVKVAAIKVFALFDKKQAISLVEQMLHSIKPVQRRNAIFCLAHFDFASVSQILLGAIKNESDEENLQQIFSIMKSNPDEETFYKTYIEARNGRSAKAEMYKELYSELARQIVASDPAKTEALLYATAEEKLEEENRSRSQRSAYQLEKIQKIRQTSQVSDQIDPGLVRFAVVAYAVGAVITAIIWFGFMAPSSQKANPGIKTAAAPFKQVTRMIRGLVNECRPAGRLVFVSDSSGQKLYRIFFPEDKGKLPAVGDQFNGQVKITGEQNGEIQAELLTAF